MKSKDADFNDADNWGYIADVIPPADSHRYIPSDPIGKINPISFNESAIVIDVSGLLYIEENATLSIYRADNLSYFIDTNGIENSGQIIIEGRIDITDIEDWGIINNSTGEITVREGGELQFFGLMWMGILNDFGAEFLNDGIIRIQSEYYYGIRSYGFFQNDGIVEISGDQFNFLDLEVLAGGFISNGEVHLYGAGQALSNNAWFLNRGFLSAGSEALNNLNGQIFNYGQFWFVNRADVFVNEGEIQNAVCAEWRVYGKIENNGTFRNDGFLQSHFSGSHELNLVIENLGVIADLSNSFEILDIDNQGALLQGVITSSNTFIDDYILGDPSRLVLSSIDLVTINNEVIGVLNTLDNTLQILDSNDGDGTYQVSSFVQLPGCDIPRRFFINITIDDQNALVTGEEPITSREKSLESTAILYPNPTSDIFNIQLDEGLELASVLVRDVKGHVILEKETKEGESTILSMESHPSGVYSVQWIDNHGKVYFEKLVVTK